MDFFFLERRLFSFYRKELTPTRQNFEMRKPPYKIKIISSKPTEKQIETGKERPELEFDFTQKKYKQSFLSIIYQLIVSVKPNYMK